MSHHPLQSSHGLSSFSEADPDQPNETGSGLNRFYRFEQSSAGTGYYSVLANQVTLVDEVTAGFVAWYRLVDYLSPSKPVNQPQPAVLSRISQTKRDEFFELLPVLSAYRLNGADTHMIHDQVSLAYRVFINHPQRLRCDPPPNGMPETHEQYSIRKKAFGQILKAIRYALNGTANRIVKSKQHYEQQRLLTRYQAYVEQLMRSTKSTGRRRLLVVRIDVSLQRASLYKHDLQRFLGYLEQFFKPYRLKPHAHRPSNDVWQHVRGYVRRVEFGVEKGWHAHLLLFIDADHLRKDYTAAQALGMHWINVVQRAQRGIQAQDMGLYYNCNGKKYQYRDRLALGLLDNDKRDFKHKMHNLLTHCLPYLFKSQSSVRYHTMPKQRLLTRGESPFSKHGILKRPTSRRRPETRQQPSKQARHQPLQQPPQHPSQQHRPVKIIKAKQYRRRPHNGKSNQQKSAKALQDQWWNQADWWERNK